MDSSVAASMHTYCSSMLLLAILAAYQNTVEFSHSLFSIAHVRIYGIIAGNNAGDKARF